MSKMKNLIKLLLLTLFVFISCTATDNNDDVTGEGNVLVLNEGGFFAGNASVTSYDPITGEAEQNYFSKHNGGRPLGDIAHSITRIGDRLFIVVNNSHKIEVVDPETFESVETIYFDGSLSPRYIEQVADNKAYVTTFTDSVAILDIAAFEITGYINAGSRTEGIAVAGQRAYVANTFNKDWSPATTVSVINTSDDEIIDSIELRAGPSSVKLDSQNRLWVVCHGTYGDNNGAVYVLDGNDGSIIETIELNAGGGDIVFYEDVQSAYISSGGIRVIDMTELTISDAPLAARNFYSLGFDDTTDPRIYAGVEKGAEQAGVALVYEINGTVADSFSTGIFPGSFYFNH